MRRLHKLSDAQLLALWLKWNGIASNGLSSPRKQCLASLARCQIEQACGLRLLARIAMAQGKLGVVPPSLIRIR